MKHDINRTSPKGEKFIGYCVNCGARNLGIVDAGIDCPGPKTRTFHEFVTGKKQ